MKTWQKLLSAQLIKTFTFFFLTLFAVYVVVDFSMHSVKFLSKASLATMGIYYLNILSTLLDLFSTLGFVLATLKVLFDLNSRRQILALQMAGLSKKRLLMPFFLFAFFLSSMNFANLQWFSPKAQRMIDTWKSLHNPKQKKEDPMRVYASVLPDHSELVYQHYDPEKKELFDVFWVKSTSDIWHIKVLHTDTMQGHFVNHLTINSKNQFENSAKFETQDFSDLPWDEKSVLEGFVPFDSRSLSTLFFQASKDSAEKAGIFSHLYYKLLTPLMPLLSLLALSPLCLRFSRNPPLFLIAACSIFGFIAFKVILDGMLILGESRALAPSLAILGPAFALAFFSLPSFVKMR